MTHKSEPTALSSGGGIRYAGRSQRIKQVYCLVPSKFAVLFKVANFEYIDEAEAAVAREEELRKRSMGDKASDSNINRANYWDELLKDRYGEYTPNGRIYYYGKREKKPQTVQKKFNKLLHENPIGDDCGYIRIEAVATRMWQPSSFLLQAGGFLWVSSFTCRWISLGYNLHRTGGIVSPFLCPRPTSSSI